MLRSYFAGARIRRCLSVCLHACACVCVMSLRNHASAELYIEKRFIIIYSFTHIDCSPLPKHSQSDSRRTTACNLITNTYLFNVHISATTRNRVNRNMRNFRTLIASLQLHKIHILIDVSVCRPWLGFANIGTVTGKALTQTHTKSEFRTNGKGKIVDGSLPVQREANSLRIQRVLIY